ncbi:MAG TPA: carbonic anhydrase [Elusimicrobiota bacterium]|nr:carbonic anhydrase [Elusimicrobiota bacterium]HMX42881.1 carbonic anhydrase [Elusimicrobiota bacterium]HMX93641.1 carbonic anhydrase [Elusimicrobiota bacterium]HMZ27249.1 carbonic anhydrase [Elusimicrobiota bacterium]HNC74392.1 carbonic anhydrase [Elusimicrobiota bacterium]
MTGPGRGLLILLIAGGAHAAEPARPVASALENVWRALADGNHRFARGALRSRPTIERRRELVAGQHPRAMILSCSDSRTPPELLFDQGLGDLFVVRSAGEVVDPVALGSLEYAADHLGVGVLVVMGHRKCGAVAAALSGEPMPTPNLDAIVKRIRPALPDPKMKETDRVRLAEESNVREAVQNILLESPLLRERVARGRLLIVPALYDLSSGRVEKLP